MKLSSTVDRRLLISWRVDPVVVAPMLPVGLRPDVVSGSAVVGICLIRLVGTRPRGWPARCGLTSEGAAHRVGVQWDDDGVPRSGVYIWRRQTDSAINTMAGGRLFPGTHERAEFDVRETEDRLRVALVARDGGTRVDVDVTVGGGLDSEVFSDVDAASSFFERASTGLSPGRDRQGLESMTLHTDAWAVEPVTIRRARSSWFDDPHRFPPGSIELDSGLLMRHVPVTWDVARRVA